MLNKVMLMGRLTADPVLRYTPNTNMAVARYSLAVERSFSKKGEEKQTDFINIVVWGKPAEFANQYFKKGSQIVITGRLQMNRWTDKNGQNRTTLEVVAEEQYFAGAKPTTGVNYGNNASAAQSASTSDANGENDFELDEGFSLDQIDESGLPF